MKTKEIEKETSKQKEKRKIDISKVQMITTKKILSLLHLFLILVKILIKLPWKVIKEKLDQARIKLN